jgi:hypothetical protein
MLETAFKMKLVEAAQRQARRKASCSIRENKKQWSAGAEKWKRIDWAFERNYSTARVLAFPSRRTPTWDTYSALVYIFASCFH